MGRRKREMKGRREERKKDIETEGERERERKKGKRRRGGGKRRKEGRRKKKQGLKGENNEGGGEKGREEGKETHLTSSTPRLTTAHMMPSKATSANPRHNMPVGHAPLSQEANQRPLMALLTAPVAPASKWTVLLEIFHSVYRQGLHSFARLVLEWNFSPANTGGSREQELCPYCTATRHYVTFFFFALISGTRKNYRYAE